MEYLKFMFSGFWTFVGCLIIASAALNFIFRCWQVFWNNLSILRRGYPPIKDNNIIDLD